MSGSSSLGCIQVVAAPLSRGRWVQWSCPGPQDVSLPQADHTLSPLRRSGPRSWEIPGGLPWLWHGVMGDRESAKKQSGGDFLLACSYLKQIDSLPFAFPLSPDQQLVPEDKPQSSTISCSPLELQPSAPG